MSYPSYYTPYQFGSYMTQQPRFDQTPVNTALPQNAAQAAPAAQNQGFYVRPVTSREEAVASQVDFFGPGTIMPDLSHGVIYLKRFNPQSGASDFFAFTVEQPKEEAPVQYATKEDIESIRAEIDQLKGKRLKKNDADE